MRNCAGHLHPGAEEEETYEITGEQGQRQIAILKMADVRRLKWNVELQLTRYRAEQEEQQGQAADGRLNTTCKFRSRFKYSLPRCTASVSRATESVTLTRSSRFRQ